MNYIVGLGNPTSDYENTRHNVGRDIVEKFRKKHKFDNWEFDKKKNALITEGKLGRHKVTLVLPETFMNDSGNALKGLITSKKKAQNLLVIYDELDLGIGNQKISFNKSSGGHKGIESIIKKIGTKEFARLRVGISPTTPKGIVKKVSGEDKVKKHVLTKFKPSEEDIMKKTFTKSVKAIEAVIDKGYLISMNEVNSWK
jgi:PTH1 family peptidyl-tRNA hydrolase